LSFFFNPSSLGFDILVHIPIAAIRIAPILSQLSESHRPERSGETEMNVSLRPYQPADLPHLMETWESANRLAHPFLDDDFVAQVRRDIPALYLPNSDTWVAEFDDRVIGFISLLGNEIGALFLQPAYHGKKVGKMLMEQAIDLYDSLEVEVFKKNSLGRGFYSKCGFELLEEKLDRQSGELVLRLSLDAVKNRQAAKV
jgi:putative acetyltransferase